MSFNNKVVVITGAGSGVGATISQKFAKKNANLALIDSNEKSLAKVAEICEKLNKIRVFKVVADLTQDDEVKKGFANLMREFGKIDVLINSAGIHIPGRVQDEDILEKFDRVMSVNLRSMVSTTNLAVPALKATKGNVINIACTSTNYVCENAVSYNVSMAGIVSFTKGAAVELAKFGIRVNAISPGPINSTNVLLSAGISETDHHELYEAFRQKSPLKMLADAEVVADLAAFLASEKAKCVTGSDFMADAGMHLNYVPPCPSATEF